MFEVSTSGPGRRRRSGAGPSWPGSEGWSSEPRPGGAPRSLSAASQASGSRDLPPRPSTWPVAAAPRPAAAGARLPVRRARAAVRAGPQSPASRQRADRSARPVDPGGAAPLAPARCAARTREIGPTGVAARGLPLDRPALPADTGSHPLEALARLPHFTEITLRELPTDAAVELARQRVRQLSGPGRDLPADTVSRVVERSGGNPFYLEELLSLVHSHGPSLPGALDLPNSVQRVVLARVDRLSEGEKAVVKVASVMPRFRAEWIAACYPPAGPPDEVARHLRRLDDLGLTRLQTT